MTISRLLGHSSFVTTMVYLHVRRPHLDSTPSPLDWLPVRQCPRWLDPNQDPAPNPPGDTEPPPNSNGKPTDPPESGYKNTENQGLENLIQGTGGETQQPAFGQSNGQ